MTVVICVGSLNLTSLVYFQNKIMFCIPFWPSLIMFFIAALAETNRVPYDLPEAESDLYPVIMLSMQLQRLCCFFLPNIRTY